MSAGSELRNNQELCKNRYSLTDWESTNYYMAKNVRDMIDTKELRDVVNTIPILWNDSPSIETGILTEKYSLGKWNSIPNLLSEQYKLR